MRLSNFRTLLLLAGSLLLAACSSTPPTVPGPMVATALQTPLYLERPSNGAIFQPSMNANSLLPLLLSPAKPTATRNASLSVSVV